MNIIKNYSLKAYNTFGIDALAKEFIEVKTTDELISVLNLPSEWPLFLLGGGSNMLLTKNLGNRVVFLNLKGIKQINENDNYIWLKAMAGENWHDFVSYTIEQNLGGLENLSLIPGHVGTAPIQNIGAYGVEIKDTFESCEAVHLNSMEIKSFSHADCQFGYRESVFKNQFKNQYAIISVTFKLKKEPHILYTSYGSIGEELAENNIQNPTIKDVSQAVIKIRQSKLPDPKVLGNSGSFFKNPVILKTDFEDLQNKFPQMPHYIVNENEVKVPAGWLIEQTGLKGFRQGDAGVHEKQALVLVNYGQATGAEILSLSKYVQKKVKEKFNINIEAEVNIF
jgi:UDP-N-acetylmuramate dehydrogenase